MIYRYYTLEASKKMQFYKVPKYILSDKRFENISLDAKVLYAIMMDRISLSLENHWLDEEGHVYIIFTIDEIMERLNCQKQKATKLVNELVKCCLIQKKRLGMGRPSRIYVMDYFDDVAENGQEENDPKSNLMKFENQTSRSMKIKLQEVRKSNSIKTDMSKTEFSKTDLSFTPFYSPTGENLSEAPKEETGEQGKTNNARVTASTKGRGNTVSTLELFHRFMDSGEEVLYECNPGTKLYQTIEEYFTYRDERKLKLTDRSVKKMVLMADSYATKYGPEKVCSVFDKSISSGYTGVFFETLDKQTKSGPRQQTKQEKWDNFFNS